MRRLAVAVLVVGAAFLAASTAWARTNGAPVVKIPLPAAPGVRIARIVVTSTARPVPFAVNAAQLGSRQGNTQVVGAVKALRKPGYYVVYVFIHRFPAVYRREASLSGGPTEAEISFKQWKKGAVDTFVKNTPCDDTGILPFLQTIVSGSATLDSDVESGLKQNGFYDDSWTTKEKDQFTMANYVPLFDTDTEEQIDNAVHAQCPAAEAPDSGSK